MPIVVHVSELEPGMALSRNIINKYSVLLPHGHKLTSGDIDSLKRRLPNHAIEVMDPLIDQLADFDDNTRDYKASLEVRRTMSGVSRKVSHLIKSSTALTGENIAGMQKTIQEMIQYLLDNPVTVALLEQSGDWNDYLQEHCASVFYISMLIGNTIKNYIKQERERLSFASNIKGVMDLTQLATAALFHDIGMVPLERIINKPGPLTEDELRLVREHPANGADMLPDSIGPVAKAAVRSHHENYNGTGYPAKISGNEINIFSRIIRVADAYCAATAVTVYAKAKNPIAVLYEMLHTDYRWCYDPAILKVLADILQPFPIGAKLNLESGKIAIVTKHCPRQPFNPQIIVAFDEQGKYLAEDKFEGPFFLNDREDVIVKLHGEDDISFINNIPKDTTPSAPAENLTKKSPDMLDMIYP